MRINSILALLFAITISITSAKSIVWTAVDKTHSTLYIADIGNNDYIYVLDETTLTQTSSVPVGDDGIYSIAVNGDYLFAVLTNYDDPSDPFELAAYELPISDTLTATQTGSAPGPTYTSSLSLQSYGDNILVVGTTATNITLVDLDTLTQVDSIKVWNTSGRHTPTEGKNVIINYDNNHVIVFYSYISGDWGVHAKEFDISSGAFVEVSTAFDPANAIGVIFNYCDIDRDNDEIWCYAVNEQEFWTFDADDLSQYTVTSVSTISYYVQSLIFDFADGKVFSFDLANAGTDSSSFAINAIDLGTGEILASYETSLAVLSTVAVALDTNVAQLYVPVQNFDNSVAPQIVVFDSNTLELINTITLTQ